MPFIIPRRGNILRIRKPFVFWTLGIIFGVVLLTCISILPTLSVSSKSLPQPEASSVVTWPVYSQRLANYTDIIQKSNISIPFLFHQTWKTADIPSKWSFAHRMCKTRNSEFNHTLWTDDMILEFVTKEHPEFLEAFQNYPYGIQRVDAAKYYIVYHYGGVFLDLDIVCRDKTKYIYAYLLRHPGKTVALAPADPFGVTSDFLIAPPKHPFMHHVVTELKKRAKGNYLLPYLTVFFTTGPLFFTNCLRTYDHPEEILIIPQRMYNGDYFGHLPGGSWHYWDGQAIWYIYQKGPKLKYLLLGMCAIVSVYYIVKRSNLCQKYFGKKFVGHRKT